MRMYGIVLAGLALAGAFTVPAAASPDSTDNLNGGAAHGCARQLDDTVRRFDELFLAKRLDEFVANYHPDATTISPAGVVATTHEQVRQSFANLFAFDFTATFPIIKQNVEGCATAVTVSDFRLDIPSLNVHSHFVNSLTWTRVHGRWLVLNGQNTPVL